MNNQKNGNGASGASLSISHLTDPELMTAIAKDRDQDALEELERRHRPMLSSVIGRVMNSQSDVPDVLQDVLLQVWNQADAYDPEKGQLLGWLITLARRRALDRVRQLCSYKGATDRYEDEVAINTQLDTGQSHTDEVEKEEATRLIEAALTKLPEKQRTTVKLAFLEGMSQREIAAALQVPLGTVKTRIELGMRRLARYLWNIKGKMGSGDEPANPNMEKLFGLFAHQESTSNIPKRSLPYTQETAPHPKEMPRPTPHPPQTSDMDQSLRYWCVQMGLNGETEHGSDDELREAVRQLLLKVESPPDQRQAITSVVVEGKSLLETAEALGIKLPVLNFRLAVGCANIRSQLKEAKRGAASYDDLPEKGSSPSAKAERHPNPKQPLVKEEPPLQEEALEEEDKLQTPQSPRAPVATIATAAEKPQARATEYEIEPKFKRWCQLMGLIGAKSTKSEAALREEVVRLIDAAQLPDRKKQMMRLVILQGETMEATGIAVGGISRQAVLIAVQSGAQKIQKTFNPGSPIPPQARSGKIPSSDKWRQWCRDHDIDPDDDDETAGAPIESKSETPPEAPVATIATAAEKPQKKRRGIKPKCADATAPSATSVDGGVPAKALQAWLDQSRTLRSDWRKRLNIGRVYDPNKPLG